MELIICLCNAVLLVISICALLYNRHKRKTYQRIADELQEIADEMEKYGVETIEELEAAKAKERAAAETENTKENDGSDVDNPAAS